MKDYEIKMVVSTDAPIGKVLSAMENALKGKGVVSEVNAKIIRFVVTDDDAKKWLKKWESTPPSPIIYTGDDDK